MDNDALAKRIIERWYHVLNKSQVDAFGENEFAIDNMDFERLKKITGDIHSVLDIGAHLGEFYVNMKYFFPSADVYSIEANPLIIEKLKIVNPQSYQALLSNRDGDMREFYLPHNGHVLDTGASYYKEASEHFLNPKVLSLPTEKLSTFLQKHDLPLTYDLIKIDTQGSELDILTSDVKSQWLIIELPIIQYNYQAPNFDDYVRKIYQLKYQIVDILEFHRGNDDRLLQIDVLCKSSN